MSAPVLATSVDLASPEAQAHDAHNRSLAAELRERVARAALGGDERSRQRHVARGKLLPRERVERLLDAGSPFLEIGQLASNGMYGDEVPGAGLITGIGMVSQRRCMVFANDATVKGGTYFPMTVKKHVRAQEILLEKIADEGPCGAGGEGHPSADSPTFLGRGQDPHRARRPARRGQHCRAVPQGRHLRPCLRMVAQGSDGG